MITKLDHDLSVLVPFFLFLTGVVERKYYYPGIVKHALGPKGHNKDTLELQFYLISH